MQSEDEVVEIPAWAGREVTEEVRYYNISLSKKPYNSWNDDEKR